MVGGSFTPSDPAIYQFVNLDSVEVEGLEAKASFAMDNGAFGRFAIAYADGKIIDPTGATTPLASVDPLNLVAGIGWRARDRNVGAELIATHHARKAEEDTQTLCTADCFRPAAFTILDATGFVRLRDDVTLRAGIFNITDETYAYWSDVRGLAASSTITEAYTRPGRNFSASIGIRF